jgi:outer membrane lipopolysaccharide assembly protein LptE/RlpB
MRATRRKLVLTPFLLLAAGCGFRLRGTADLPFGTVEEFGRPMPGALSKALLGAVI